MKPRDIGTIHSNDAEPYLIQKACRKCKEKKFDIEKIFDHDFKPGKEVKIAKKERKTPKERFAFSFNTRDQGRVALSYNKVLPYK